MEHSLAVFERLSLIGQIFYFIFLPDAIRDIDDGEDHLEDDIGPGLLGDHIKFDGFIDSVFDGEEEGGDDEVEHEVEQH